MNKGVLFLLSMVLSSLLLFFAACQPVETPPESVTHTYLGAGSYGDVITYELTHTTPTSGTFSYYNETKDQRGTGTFTELTDPRYKGILEAMLDGDDVSKYYCIEIPDRLMITSVPSGNDNNRLIFAITNEQDIGPSDCVDDYMWIYYYDGIAPDAFDYETKYGGFSLTDEPYNGKYKYYYGAAPAGVNPEDFPEAFYPEYFTGTAPWDVDVGGIGEWYIAGKRLKYKETEGISPNQGVELTGLICKTENSKLYVMDQGEGMGFTVGFEYPMAGHLSQAQIAGEYKFVSVTFGPGQTACYGTYQIPASGDGTAYSHVVGANPPDYEVAITEISEVETINNTFSYKSVINGETIKFYYAVLSEADGIAMGSAIIESGPSAGNVSCISFAVRMEE